MTTPQEQHMRRSPTLDWTCSHCGAKETLQLVAVGSAQDAAPTPSRTVPTLDWTCSRCGASETLQLVKV